jgi:hypothetical protein
MRRPSPIPRATEGTAALVLVGDVRNPFTALDDAFLLALGQQIGSALDSPSSRAACACAPPTSRACRRG